jgi:cytochrome bd-type quinol oxidase subunit 1
MARRCALPVVHSFACFLAARPNEQIYNQCSEHSKVVYVASLAGLLPGGPGHSHQSVRDISALAAVPGLVMAAVAIVHVFLAQFAVGGGILLCYFQWLAMTGRNPYARQFVDGYFKVLVLISFVVGALTGVGIWFTSIQISPRTIGELVLNFHWLWATEWTFFILEIVAGYCFYRYHHRVSDRAAMTLLVLYSFAAWGSLFWINGILSWQLTPGRWLETHYLWDGFFNPGFWPSLLFRTVVAMTLAALVACVVVNTMRGLDRAALTSLINRAAHLMIPMVLMPALGVFVGRIG